MLHLPGGVECCAGYPASGGIASGRRSNRRAASVSLRLAVVALLSAGPHDVLRSAMRVVGFRRPRRRIAELVLVRPHRGELEAQALDSRSIGRVRRDHGAMTARAQFERDREIRVQVAERAERGENDTHGTREGAPGAQGCQAPRSRVLFSEREPAAAPIRARDVMKDKTHEFQAPGITVSWSRLRCIHAAECVFAVGHRR